MSSSNARAIAASTASTTHIRNLAFWQSNQSRWKAGSTVLVTGAGSGIGREIAFIYARRKCQLVLGDINGDSLKPVVARCIELGSEAVGVPTDVTKVDQCEKLVNTAGTKFGGLDVLVLCAGLGAHHLFANTSTPDMDKLFHKLMDVNFYGYLYCTHFAYPLLSHSKGNLIAITSFSGEVGLPFRTAYCASKFAVTGFLESLRAEMADQKVGGFDITIVCPPTVETNLRKNSLTPDSKLKEAAPSKSALTVEDCATAIVDAGDRRLRKAFFPWKSWAASYLRPLIPDVIDKRIWQRSRL